jgi:uncharacterized protein YhhL (DUF1145 family)
MLDFFSFVLTRLLRAWQRGSAKVRAIIFIGVVLLGASAVVAWATDSHFIMQDMGRATAGVLFALAGMLLLYPVIKERLREEESTRARIEKVEEQVREHPDKPQLAWDLARTKLENYLDKNLGQLQSIFWLTSFVMLVGFGFVLFGLMKAYESTVNFPVSIVASASGVLISFIGGSFLLIYKSILAHTRRFVSVLERINAVGMAVQVLGSISEDNVKLRNESTAALAKHLLTLYSGNQFDFADQDPPPRRRRTPRPTADEA